MHNNGHGGFDDVSGSVGLDLDHDGRSFAVLDLDGDGDPDLIVMGARSSPQLQVFRNDNATGAAAVAIKLVGTKSNHDAVGARVTVETDQVRVTRVVTAGSGFLSQHSKQLLCGLGHSTRIVKMTIVWPSGATQTLVNVPINERVTIEEGSDQIRHEPFRPATPAALAAPAPKSTANTPGTTTVGASRAAGAGPILGPGPGPGSDAGPGAGAGVWLYQPFPAPAFTLRDLDGQERSLAAAAGHPLLIYFWSPAVAASGAALASLSKAGTAGAGGAAVYAITVPSDTAPIKAAGVPVMLATEEVAGAYNVVHRYLFDRPRICRCPPRF